MGEGEFIFHPRKAFAFGVDQDSAEKQGKRGMLASDISAELKELLKEETAEREKRI